MKDALRQIPKALLLSATIGVGIVGEQHLPRLGPTPTVEQQIDQASRLVNQDQWHFDFMGFHIQIGQDNPAAAQTVIAGASAEVSPNSQTAFDLQTAGQYLDPTPTCAPTPAHGAWLPMAVAYFSAYNSNAPEKSALEWLGTAKSDLPTVT